MIEKLSPEARTFLSDFLNQIEYEKDKEIERLNNIINELEKYIGRKMNSFGVCNASDIYHKLQELKGSDKE